MPSPQLVTILQLNKIDKNVEEGEIHVGGWPVKGKVKRTKRNRNENIF